MNELTREDARRAVREAVTRHALEESQGWAHGSGEWRRMVSEEYAALGREIERMEKMRPLLDRLVYAKQHPQEMSVGAASLAVANAWRDGQ